MNYQISKKIYDLFGTLLITAVYFGRTIRREPVLLTADADFARWGKVILIFMAVTIVAKIILEILFRIGAGIANKGELEPDITDERDKLIELKGLRVSHIVFSLGFVASMAVLAMGHPAFLLFPILIGGGMISEVADNVTQIILYGRGF